VSRQPFNAAEWLVDRHIEAGDGERTAFRFGSGVITYDAVQRLTWRAAGQLVDLGVGPGDRFVMVVRDEPGFPAFFLGGLRIGAVPIPVSTMLKPADVAALVSDSGSQVMVLSNSFATWVPVLAESHPSLRFVLTGDTPESDDITSFHAVHQWSSWTAADPVPTSLTTAEATGFWLYTSGTTGRPKGAVHCHGDIRAVATTYARSVLGIGPDDVCYSVAKLFFAFGLGNSLIFPLSVGASAVLDPQPPTPARVAELATYNRPSLFFAPPGFCAALADSDAAADCLASVRATVTAGETLPAEVLRRFTGRFGTEMLDGIGSTEALHIFCSNHPGDVRPGSTGRPVDGYGLRILDENGNVISEPDTPGALWVRGESVTRGYWQRPDDNEATFVDGWCRTGDVYRRDAEGYYWFVGRNSDMIKAGGIWVSPAEVEAVLLEHAAVLEAAVVGSRNSDGLETTVAFVVPASGATVDVEALLTHCRERMAAFKRPRVVHVVDSLPRTATGKIQRFALRARLEAEVGGTTVATHQTGGMEPFLEIAIREALAADFENWFRLYDSVAAEGRWIGGEAPSDRAARQRAFDAYLSDPDAVSFLAEADGKLVGNLGVEIRGGIADLGMMVDADWRGRGVGSALMEACIVWATGHGAHKLVLEVWPHNTSAQGLYRKYGFEQEGFFKRHYRRRNGELWDVVRMGLVLDQDSPGSRYGSD
jgi:benzoate-CoA ligase